MRALPATLLSSSKGAQVPPTEIQLSEKWTVGPRLGAGGFGQVFEVHCGEKVAAAKFVPKDEGAARELLFVDLGPIDGVVPILETGETRTEWILLMPRAERSLRDHMVGAVAGLSISESLTVLVDVARALVAIDGKVVHRDLKPENILSIDGRWCLADFGVSRYAEAATATATHKHALSPSYAAPERWRAEHATASTDVYSFGVIAYELVSGARPFLGPQLEDYREQHLHAEPNDLGGVPAQIAALVMECLYKSAGTRPSAQNLLARLEAAQRSTRVAGLTALREANRTEVARLSSEATQWSREQTEEKRRAGLARDGQAAMEAIRGDFIAALEEVAPAAKIFTARGGIEVILGQGRLAISPVVTHSQGWESSQSPRFDVVLTATITVTKNRDQWGYSGRSHEQSSRPVDEDLLGRFG